MSDATISLDEQLQHFRDNRFMAMPIAGMIAWAIIGLVGATASEFAAVWAIFIGTGSIFYLGIGVAKLTGEDLLGRERKSSLFDKVFLLTTVQAVAVYAIAIPFLQLETSSLPMSVGILTGLMWIPFSALSGHWVGLFHGLTRTILIVAAYYLLPNHRFVAIPAIIVAVYAVTLYVLARRYRGMRTVKASP
jgi:hypothetical protein